MTSASTIEEPDGHEAVHGRINAVGALIGIVLLVAVLTTIHGFYQLTGSYWYAIPFGLVVQAILLLVSLNLGRDIARFATGRASEISGVGGARYLRAGFLIFVYLLFFAICWFFAFSTYFNIFLKRGDDIETAATQIDQYNSLVLGDLRAQVIKIQKEADDELKASKDFTDYIAWADKLRDVVSRPEVGRDISKNIEIALNAAYEARRSDQEGWQRQISELKVAETSKRQELGRREADLTARQAALKALPQRNADLQRAIDQEMNGTLAPPQSGSADAPAADGAQPAQRPAQPAAAATAGRLPAKGLAAMLVSSKACAVERKLGKGDCLTALTSAQRDVSASEARLGTEIAGLEAKLPTMRAELEDIPRQRESLELRLKQSGPLSRPNASNAGGIDTGPFNTALGEFRRSPSDETFRGIVDACRPIEAALRPSKWWGQESLGNVTCRPESLVAAVDSLEKTKATAEGFKKLCSEGAAGERTATIVSAMRNDFNEQKVASDMRRERLAQGFDAVRRDVVAPCTGQAALVGASLEKVNRDAQEFLTMASLRQSEFSLAVNAAKLVSRLQGTPPAYLGALFAAAQELAILLLSILRDLNQGTRTASEEPERQTQHHAIDWSLRSDDPAQVIAAKTLLQAIVGHAGSATLPANYAEDEKPDIQANMRQIVRELIRDGLVKQAFIGSALRVSTKAIDNIERRVINHHAATRVEPTRVEPIRPAANVAATPQRPPPGETSPTPSEARPEPVSPAPFAPSTAGQGPVEAPPSKGPQSPFFGERRRVGITADNDEDRF